MTEEQIDALLDETVTKPKDEWTEVRRLALVAAYRRADQETKDMVLAILRGEIGVAVSISVPR